MPAIMGIRLFGLIAVWFLISGLSAFAQTDTTKFRRSYKTDSSYRYQYNFRDSASFTRWQARKDSLKAIQDSVLTAQDSIKMVWLKVPPINRPNKFADSLIKLYTIKDADFVGWARKFPKKQNRFDQGKLKSKGEAWVLAVVIALILFFAVLKKAFSKEITTIIQAFYSNRILSHISKEENLFSSWPFVFLYILFGFTLGMFLYLCGRYLQLSYAYSDFQWYTLLSVLTLTFFALKIITLRLLAFLFNIPWVVKEYISILYLSYFNGAILFLPLVVAFSLSPLRYANVYIYVGLAITVFVLLILVLRIATNILAKYRFSKTYLFIYLCALEVCPLLVLIKALRF